MTPTTFACGVDIVGPSNLNTLLASIPPYWESFKRVFASRVGDPDTEEGRALLTERSPLTFVDQIQRPLLIGQGANDPRVKQAESDQIVAAMQAKNIPVTYALYPDEGHGFARPPNRLSFNAVTEGFLGTCLGGRVEPVGSDLEGSTLQVPAGAELVPGLSDALKAIAPAAAPAAEPAAEPATAN
jgi:dipeptidyl aminopeptidase/acylaminoacyl peptidase